MDGPRLIWTDAAGTAALDGYEQVAFDALLREVVAPANAARGGREDLANPAQAWLDRVKRADRLAVRGVELRTLEDLRALHGYVLEPAWRADIRLLVESDRKLTALDPAAFTDPGFAFAYTLERALHAAGQIWRPDPAPTLTPTPAPAPQPSTAAPSTLDPAQRRAVTAPDGTVQIIAPAGSGKTTVLIERIRELLRRGVPGDKILATTFNRAAAAELQQRLAAAGVHGVEARTFHSLGLRILESEGLLRRNGVKQFSLGQWRRLCTIALKETGTWLEVADARAAISEIKLGELRTAREFMPRTAADQALARVYELYERAQLERQTHDYDDLILHSVLTLRADPALRARWQQRFSHVLVDEYQDIEPAQELLVRILAAPQDALFCVGDDDQTLYGFRRASVRRIIDLDLAYPGLERVALTHNYRCPPRIVAASRALIDRNRIRFPKAIAPAPGRRDKDRVLELHEPATQADGAARIATALAAHARGQIVCLARTTNMLRTVALACADLGVRISAPAAVFEAHHARAALEAYMRLCSDPGHARAADVVQVCRTPNRGLPFEAEEHAAELLRSGLSFAQTFAALPANDVQRERLLTAGRTLDTLAQLKDARAFIGYLRRRGGLDAYFSEHEAAFGETEQIELEVLAQSETEAAGRSVADYLDLLERRTDALREVRDDTAGIELTTIHRAKGRQWPRVELFACEEGQLPHRRALDVSDAKRAQGEGEEAERRLAYVAFTRASETLSITTTASAPSRFLADAGLTPRSEPDRRRGTPAERRSPEPPTRRPSTAHADPAVAKALAEAVRVGLNYALRTAPDRRTALQTATTALERRLLGEVTTSQSMTVAKLFDAIEPLTPDERRGAIGADADALVRRLDDATRTRIMRELRSLAG